LYLIKTDDFKTRHLSIVASKIILDHYPLENMKTSYENMVSTLVHAFVMSRLDYCSAIYEELVGLLTCRLKCLDRVLRMAAALWAAFLGLAGSLGICGMSFTGSPTHSALSTSSLRWFGAA